VSFQATEKLSFHERLEYTKEKFDLKIDGTPIQNAAGNPIATEAKIVALTSTVQYDLWKNVISRLEFRWDRSVNGDSMFQGNTAGDPTRKNAFLLAANIIYKF
jgi:hypothetical protein